MLLAKPVYRVTTDIYNWLLPLLVINILWTLLSLTFVLLPTRYGRPVRNCLLSQHGRRAACGTVCDSSSALGVEKLVMGCSIDFRPGSQFHRSQSVCQFGISARTYAYGHQQW